MDIFLSLIDEQEIEKAGQIIPKNFEEKVISKVSIPKEKLVKGKKKIFNYQFGTYVAAASVTIFLSLSGFYIKLVDTVPKLTMSIQINNYRLNDNSPNLVADLSNSIVNATSNLMGSIKNIDRIKEVK